MNQLRSASALVAACIVLVGLAGCTDDAHEPIGVHDDGRIHTETDLSDQTRVGFEWAPGALSSIENEGTTTIRVDLPTGWLLVDGSRFSIAPTVELAAGEHASVLIPPGAQSASVSVAYEGTATVVELVLPAGPAPTQQLVSGENVWDLSAYQEANFPHRKPDHPNYALSMEYFADFFADLGYQVEIDPFGLADVNEPCPTGLTGAPVCPAALANVVATKPGTIENGPIIFVAGGHFDMVTGTTHAAIDDTSGTVATLELARALADYEFEHTLMFGLWGGEESGLLGSAFWVQHHPELRNRIVSYWNLDGIGASFPAPLPRPDPILLTAGPDVPDPIAGGGQTIDPISDSLLGWAQTLQSDWLQYPQTLSSPRDGDRYEAIIYEGVAAGQVDGYNGYNAQSDQTSFIAVGIPAYFMINADYDGGEAWPVISHTERDTLNNLTKYAYYAEEFDIEDASWESPQTFAAARQALADSWDPYLWFPFYHAVLIDLGVYTPPSLAEVS